MQLNEYRRLMRNHAGAPVVIATGALGARTGLTATAFCSLSDAPPTVLVCVNKHASAHPLIQQMKTFSVNLLRKDQAELALTFSGQTGLNGEARFDGAWTQGATGVPLLALAVLDCEVISTHDHGSHTVFIGRVRFATADDTAEPLIYFRGGFGGFGDLQMLTLPQSSDGQRPCANSQHAH